MALGMMFDCGAEAFDESLGSRESYEEFLSLFSRSRDRLYAHIFALIPHEADAEDIFQRCSILLWRKFQEFDPDRSRFITWACGIALYEVKNFAKTQRRSRLTFQPELMEQIAADRLSEEEGESERMELLKDCVESLHPRERDLLHIAYDETSTMKEHAQNSGQSLQVLYNRLAKVRRTLLACVERKLSRRDFHG